MNKLYIILLSVCVSLLCSVVFAQEVDIDFSGDIPSMEPGRSLATGAVGFFNDLNTEDSDTMDKMLYDLKAMRRLPNDIFKLDYPWKRVVPTSRTAYTFESIDFMEMVQLGNGSSIIALIDAPAAPNWIGEWPYECYDNGINVGKTPLEVYEDFLDGTDSESGLTGSEKMALWEDYVETFVQACAPTFDYYEIINEPENFIFNAGHLSTESKGNFADYYQDFYFELIKRASRIIRKYDPSAKIMAGGFTNVYSEEAWSLATKKQQVIMLEAMAQEGLWDEYLDILCLHNYPFALPNVRKLKYDELVSLRRVRECLSLYGYDSVPVWYTEFAPDPDSNSLMPTGIARTLALGLQYGLEVASFYKYYDTDNIQETLKTHLAVNQYPALPGESLPQFQSYKILKSALIGAVYDEAINSASPEEDSSLVYRAFHNGLQYIVVAWANSDDQLLRINDGGAESVRSVYFRANGSIEDSVQSSGSEFALMEDDSLLLVVTPVQVLPQMDISVVSDGILLSPHSGMDNSMVIGTQARFQFNSSDGRVYRPMWTVEADPDDTQVGKGTISLDGVFTPISAGTMRIAASIGGDFGEGTLIAGASFEFQIVDVDGNLLRNPGFNEGLGSEHSEGIPWRLNGSGADEPNTREWVESESGDVIWHSERNAHADNGSFMQFAQPWVVNPGDELMAVGRIRHTNYPTYDNPMFEFGLYSIDRLGVKAKDFGDHRFIEYAKTIAAPEETWRYERATPLVFSMTDTATSFLFYAHIIHTLEDKQRRGSFDMDAAYAGPPQDVVLIRPSDYPGADVSDGSQLEVLYYVDEVMHSGNKLRLGWTFDPFASGGAVLNDIAGAGALSPDAVDPFVWVEPALDVDAVYPGSGKPYIYLVAEVYDESAGTVVAQDIGGPVKVLDLSGLVTPTPPPVTPTFTPTLSPTATVTPTATPTNGVQVDTPTPLPEDLDKDGVVDQNDLFLLMKRWHNSQ